MSKASQSNIAAAAREARQPKARDENSPVVLQVVPELDVPGGTERSTVEIAQALAAAGWRSLVASTGGAMVRQVESSGARHIQLPLKGKNPIRIILDSHGTIKNSSKIIKTSKHVPTIVVTSQLVSKSNFNRLKNLPLDVLVCGKNQVDLKKLVLILCKKGIKRILLEGGGTLNLSFLKNNLIDEMIITLTPYVLGSKNSVNLFEGTLKLTKNLSSFKLKKVQKNTNEIILNYKI